MADRRLKIDMHLDDRATRGMRKLDAAFREATHILARRRQQIAQDAAASENGMGA